MFESSLVAGSIVRRIPGFPWPRSIKIAGLVALAASSGLGSAGGADWSEPPSWAIAVAGSDPVSRLSKMYIGAPVGPPNKIEPIGPSRKVSKPSF